MNNQFILVGIEGRANQFKGWVVHADEDSLSFWLGDNPIETKYSEYPGFISDFESAELNMQTEHSLNLKLSSEEDSQSEIRVQACIDTLNSLSNAYGKKPLLVGIGMPGLKSRDKRSIVLSTFGPRLQNFCDRVEKGLNENRVELITPITRLGSDVDYCGIGEEYFVAGSFRNFNNCYYLGGGTGAGDTLKLDEELISLDETKSWIAKTWELKNEHGVSFEQYTSIRGIQSVYSLNSDIPLRKVIDDSITPKRILELACQGNSGAIKTLKDISNFLALLIGERIVTLYSGWKNSFDFMEKGRAKLDSSHPYTGTLLDRIVFGQRFGELVRASQSTRFLWKDFIKKLSEVIESSPHLDTIAKEHYLSNGILASKIIHISPLTNASILGAGIDAYLGYKGIRV